MHSLKYVYDANPWMIPLRVLQFSKRDTLKQFPEELIPKTLTFVWKEINKIQVEKFSQEVWGFPLIAKPDLGERGVWVTTITSREHLEKYVASYEDEVVLLQELIQYPIELWVMYYRYPTQTKWKISWVTLKEFNQVTWDGRSTVRELVEGSERGARYTDYFSSLHGSAYDAVLEKWVVKKLTNIGNHSRWTRFIDYSEIINDKLVTVFDKIASHVDWFYYGRFDIKISSLEDLYKWNNIKILELNWVASEPAHGYDEQYSLWDRYKELLKHRKIMAKISAENRKNWHQTSINFFDHICNPKPHIYNDMIVQSKQHISSLIIVSWTK